MKIRRQITGALCGLLDTYSSRYSDYDGYWIFGLLARDMDSLSIDLMAEDPRPDSSPVVAKAQRLARAHFKEQIQLAHIPLEFVAEARLTMLKKEPKVGPIQGYPMQAHQFSMVAEAASDLGKKYRAQKYLFIAPHNPKLEIRSVRREEANQSSQPTSLTRRG